MNQIALNVDCMEYMQALPDKAFDFPLLTHRMELAFMIVAD